MRMMLYAGPLTRYYAHRFSGATPVPADQPPLDTVEALLTQWRDTVTAVTENELGVPAFWEESRDGRYCTARPDWEGWYALLLWALYDAAGKTPEELPDNWLSVIEEIPVFAAAAQNGCPAYPVLAANCELFLPMDTDELLWGPDPTDQPDVPMGPIPALLRELECLNERTFHADETTIEAWEALPLSGRKLEPLARRGFAALWRVARFADRQQYPIRLDYDEA